MPEAVFYILYQWTGLFYASHQILEQIFTLVFAVLPTSASLGPAFSFLQSLPKMSDSVIVDADNIFGMRFSGDG